MRACVLVCECVFAFVRERVCANTYMRLCCCSCPLHRGNIVVVVVVLIFFFFKYISFGCKYITFS